MSSNERAAKTREEQIDVVQKLLQARFGDTLLDYAGRGVADADVANAIRAAAEEIVSSLNMRGATE